MDPTILEQCIPGYESLTVSEENVFEGKIKLGIAVVKGIYEGKVRILDKYKPEHFKMVLDGKGTLGIIHAEAIIYLSQKENGNTYIEINSEVAISGVLGRVGQRLMGGAAKMLFRQFFTSLEKMAR